MKVPLVIMGHINCAQLEAVFDEMERITLPIFSANSGYPVFF